MTQLDGIGIVADDLTGGAAIGGELARLGHVVHIVGVDHATPIVGSVVVDTSSRYLPAQLAAYHVRVATSRLRQVGYRALMKKVDSTLKGNVGVELAAFAETCGGPLLIAPACPEVGLTLLEGHQHTPTGPGVNVAELIAHALPTQPTVLPLDTVRRGAASVASWLRDHADDTVLADGESDADLVAVASGAVAAGVSAFSGTYGLGAALASVLPARQPAAFVTPPIDRLLVIAGSASPVTIRQVENLVAAGAEEVVLDVEVALDGDPTDSQSAHLLRCVDSSSAAVLVVHTGARQTGLRVRERSTRLGWNERDLAECFAVPLAATASAANGAALLLVGGETAGAVLNRLGVECMAVCGESSPAIPLILPDQEHWPLLLTKPGAFGTDTVLTHVADALLANWRHPLT